MALLLDTHALIWFLDDAIRLPTNVRNCIETTPIVFVRITSLWEIAIKAIKRILTQEAYVVDWLQLGDKALAYLENDLSLYTVGVFDWMLPGRSGIELCQWWRDQHHALPCPHAHCQRPD